jgi:hypothetical protein
MSKNRALRDAYLRTSTLALPRFLSIWMEAPSEPGSVHFEFVPPCEQGLQRSSCAGSYAGCERRS